MTPEGQVEGLLRGQIADIVAGTVFVFIGVSACLIAAVRRRSGVRLVLWLGIWSAMYGVLQLSRVDSFGAALPQWLQRTIPLVNTASLYLILVVATIAFLEITTGPYRIFLLAVMFSALGIAIAAIAIFLRTGYANSLILYNNLLAICSLVVLLVIVMVPKLSRRYIALPSRGVLAGGMLVFAAEALLANLTRSLRLRDVPIIMDSIGFAILLFSFGYVALQMVAVRERRLLAIENELEIARQLQFSILPSETPSVKNLRIAALYEPMTAVAGDFYEFFAVDEYRAGFLVADVSGHGVPAALIASMIKVAMQTVAEWARNPAEVLRRLKRTLSGQLRGQFITAAYLWIDTETRTALYSAAGHPPLLRLRGKDGALERIESNGLLFGVATDTESDYPVGEVGLQSGDRFLLYTDGIVEPENAAGEAFGDRRLEQIMKEDSLRPPAELCQRLVAEVAAWQPSSGKQQDDITLILIDVV